LAGHGGPDNDVVERLRVPGGWLYRTRTQIGFNYGDPQWHVAMAFVPDAPADDA
jgi:hypothetical protein